MRKKGAALSEPQLRWGEFGAPPHGAPKRGKPKAKMTGGFLSCPAVASTKADASFSLPVKEKEGKTLGRSYDSCQRAKAVYSLIWS